MLVVHMVGRMEMLMEKFNVMKLFVNPINHKLNQNKIESYVEQTEEPIKWSSVE